MYGTTLKSVKIYLNAALFITRDLLKESDSCSNTHKTPLARLSYYCSNKCNDTLNENHGSISHQLLIAHVQNWFLWVIPDISPWLHPFITYGTWTDNIYYLRLLHILMHYKFFHGTYFNLRHCIDRPKCAIPINFIVLWQQLRLLAW